MYGASGDVTWWRVTTLDVFDLVQFELGAYVFGDYRKLVNFGQQLILP